MSIITSSGNSIPIDLEDEEIMNHVFDRTSCAKIIINQINNDRMYDPFLKDKKDLVILDIGANVGLFTLYAQDSASKVISVEPTPSHQNLFEKICGKYENVELVKAALSDKNEDVSFYTCNENSTQNSLVKGEGTAVGESPSDENKVTVRGVTLETLLNEYNIEHVDFCKIDIEGSEMIAITEETLKPVYDKIDRMFIEVHSTYSGTDMRWEDHIIINRKKIEKILDNVGYKYRVLPTQYQETLHVFKDSETT
jgi:FkbM family methyltransferase